MADLQRFLFLLTELRQTLRSLHRYQQQMTSNELLSDSDKQNMVLFAIYRAIQATIDLGQHWIAEEGLRTPTTYREVFQVLLEDNVLEEPLARQMQSWAGLRNVIAHHYASVDFQLISQALYQELEQLDEFAKVMATLAPDTDS